MLSIIRPGSKHVKGRDWPPPAKTSAQEVVGVLGRVQSQEVHRIATRPWQTHVKALRNDITKFEDERDVPYALLLHGYIMNSNPHLNVQSPRDLSLRVPASFNHQIQSVFLWSGPCWQKMERFQNSTSPLRVFLTFLTKRVGILLIHVFFGINWIVI